MKQILGLPLILAALVTLAVLPSHAAPPAPKTVTVDYVIALLDAGVAQPDIVTRIEERHLAFRVAPGDIDRLREAGAGQELVDRVIGGEIVLENHESARPRRPAGKADRNGKNTNGWERPSRMGDRADAEQPPSATDPDDDEAEDYDAEGIIEETDGGSYGYPAYEGYYSGYYGYLFSYGYGYPYYYSPYYDSYPYRSYAYYSSPYCHIPRHSFRTVPRGGGSIRGVPRGGGGSAPRGGGGGRPSPRGSRHH